MIVPTVVPAGLTPPADHVPTIASDLPGFVPPAEKGWYRPAAGERHRANTLGETP